MVFSLKFSLRLHIKVIFTKIAGFRLFFPYYLININSFKKIEEGFYLILLGLLKSF